MLRTIFAVIAGLLATMLVITVVELASSKFLFPPPPSLDYTDMAAVNAFVASMPVAAILVILAGWLLGTFVGAFVTAKFAVKFRLPAALLIGAFIVVATAMNAMNVTHPTWMIVAGLLLPIPVAYLAARLAQKGLPSTR